MERLVDTGCTYEHTPSISNTGTKLQEWQKTESHLKLTKCSVFYTVMIKTVGSPVFCFTLYKYRFGHAWENHDVGNVSHFLRAFKQRLIDCFLQDWNSSINSVKRPIKNYVFYSSLKQLYELTPYLTAVKNPVFRKALTKIRLGVSALRPHQWSILKCQ